MPIKLAENFRAVFYAPFYAAQSLGFYASEGVEVELVNPCSCADAWSGSPGERSRVRIAIALTILL